jgi:hypothetical protein
VRAIDRLEAENQALVTELRYYQAADAQLKKIREAIKTLLSEKSEFSADRTARELAALLDLAPPSAA